MILNQVAKNYRYVGIKNCGNFVEIDELKGTCKIGITQSDCSRVTVLVQSDPILWRV